jgi:hypothetical protein
MRIAVLGIGDISAIRQGRVNFRGPQALWVRDAR